MGTYQGFQIWTLGLSQWFCWCHLAMKLKYVILAIFIFKHDFMVPCLVPAVLRHHGGCGWPGSRWTSVHQQPSDWFNHCSYVSLQRDSWQPTPARTLCFLPASVWISTLWPSDLCFSCLFRRLLLHSTFFFFDAVASFQAFSFVYVCASLCFCTILLFCRPVFYASVFRHQRHFWGTYTSGLKFGMIMYPDHLRNQLDLHHILFIFLILAQLTL